MPIAQSNGCPIHYEVEGDESKPVLMFCNSLGTNLHMWDGQMPAVLKHFRVVRYDRRGHGKSGVPAGPYNMEMLGRDALAVLDAAKVEKTNWCGLSMGGMVGMWLGANAPQRVNRLILSNTSAYFPDKEIWNGRSRPFRTRACRRSCRDAGALVHRGLPRARAAEGEADRRHVPRHQAGGLHRLRSGGARHGPPRDHQIDQGTDDGHRGQAGCRHHARDGRGHPEEHSGRQPRRCSMPRTSPTSSAGTPIPTRCWIS